jgi:hypothetical protein
MVKHSVTLMQPFFTRARFGRPQLFSSLLLLVFATQVIWLVRSDLRSSEPDPLEQFRVDQGLRQWRGQGIAGMMDRASDTTPSPDAERSPLIYLVSSAQLLGWPDRLRTPESARTWRWLPRFPFLGIGLLLGASLWYVSRRLCTNFGGFVALILYCFSPAMIQASALWHTQPSIVAAWGSFGAVFTAIAVAHTLYAPREVVLWNWRRTALLGISFALAIGGQFSMVVVAPVALLFLMYVAPVRRRAGLAIWAASCAVAAILFAAFYFFHLRAMSDSLRHATFIASSLQGLANPGVYRVVFEKIIGGCPAFVLLLPVTLIVYAFWSRTRYFGNTTPLLVGLLFAALALMEPHTSSAGFILSAVPFLFIFVAGVITDLAETRYRQLVIAGLGGLLGVYVLWNLHALALVSSGVMR